MENREEKLNANSRDEDSKFLEIVKHPSLAENSKFQLFYYFSHVGILTIVRIVRVKEIQSLFFHDRAPNDQ